MPLLAAGSFNLLAVNPGLVIWTAITFLVVLLVLWRFAWKPIISALDARNERVENDLKESRELREKAENLLREYEQKMESARAEAMQLLDEGRKDAEVQKAKIITAAKEEAERLISRAHADIEQAKLKAISELEQSTVQITVQILSRILQRDVNNEEHKKIVLQELGAIRKNNIQGG